MYASKLEASYADVLYRRAWAGEILMAEPQIKFPLVVNGVLICTYVADFLVTNNDGSAEVHETKGRFAPGAKTKLKLFEALHKELPLKVIGAKYKSVWDKPKRGKK